MNLQTHQKRGGKKWGVRSDPRSHENEIVMHWSGNTIRLGYNGNLRECEHWVNEGDARTWCARKGIIFRKVGA